MVNNYSSEFTPYLHARMLFGFSSVKFLPYSGRLHEGYTGRKTGRLHQTVVGVVQPDPVSETFYVASG